jgi:phage-related minor tail protein
MQRRASKIRSELDEISNGLQHSLAQKASIQRLQVYAEERLSQEKERKKEIERELSSVSSGTRYQLEFTLDTIYDQINEIRNEIRQRSLTGKKVDKLIEEYTTKKSRLSVKIKKALESKPQVAETMHKSKKNIVKLEKRLPSLIKTEDNVKKNFSRINSIIRERAKARKKTKAKRKASRKPKAKRKSRKRR